MGRHVGRSKGCKTCLQRKVKCDEALPHCGGCLRLGKHCPGPFQGTFFVDSTAIFSQSRTTRRGVRKRCGPKKNPAGLVLESTDTESVKSSSVRASLGDGKASPTIPGYHPNECCLDGVGKDVIYPNLVDDMAIVKSSAADEFRLPSTYRPNPADQFQHLYLSHFIESYSTVEAHKSGLHAWTRDLPAILSLSTSQTATFALRATTMALYSKMTGDKGIEIDACRWYTKGLETQRESLKHTVGCISTDVAICSAIMFSVFESIISTTPRGWLEHFSAAANMVYLRGAEKCQRGLVHRFFRSVRLASVTICMTIEEPSPFAAEEWCTIPFDVYPKTAFDVLIDILLQLPSCLSSFNEMRKQAGSRASKKLREEVIAQARRIISDLNRFWNQHKAQIDPNYDRRWLCNLDVDLGHVCGSSTVYSTPFQSPFMATFTALYDTASMLGLRYLGAALGTPESYKNRITMHAESILAAVAYHESSGLFSGGTFNMVFPLKIVCILAPSESQRNIAQQALLTWGANRGVDDACRVAAPFYMERGRG